MKLTSTLRSRGLTRVENWIDIEIEMWGEKMNLNYEGKYFPECKNNKNIIPSYIPRFI